MRTAMCRLGCYELSRDLLYQRGIQTPLVIIGGKKRVVKKETACHGG
jgi:hypothetical protein